jgi:shikimate kinase
MKQHLFLVGYRGSGKSSVGRILAEQLKLSLIDSDEQIERESGKPIREIFLEVGEEGFRDLESWAIEKIGDYEFSTVVSLGGGAVLRPENRAVLHRTGRSVWLQASPEQLAARIAADQSTGDRRPALTSLAALDEIIKLLAMREPLYREVAEHVVSTDDRSPFEIADEIADWYRSHIAEVNQ